MQRRLDAIRGVMAKNGIDAALMALGTYPYSYAAYYDLAVIPLFVLMGSIASACGMGQALFAAAYAWVGHWRGGLASATILSCAGFAAVLAARGGFANSLRSDMQTRPRGARQPRTAALLASAWAPPHRGPLP